jgi:hypothetical protein
VLGRQVHRGAGVVVDPLQWSMVQRGTMDRVGYGPAAYGSLACGLRVLWACGKGLVWARDGRYELVRRVTPAEEPVCGTTARQGAQIVRLGREVWATLGGRRRPVSPVLVAAAREPPALAPAAGVQAPNVVSRP